MGDQQKINENECFPIETNSFQPESTLTNLNQ